MNMKSLVFVVVVVTLAAGTASAQTCFDVGEPTCTPVPSDTPTPTITPTPSDTPTPTPDVVSYGTVVVPGMPSATPPPLPEGEWGTLATELNGTVEGQEVVFEYRITAGDFIIAVLLFIQVALQIAEIFRGEMSAFGEVK